MWPTPTTQDNNQVKGSPDHPKRGTTLGGAVRQWPTPTASDSQGGAREMDGKRGRALKDLPQQMWPTPTANEDAAGTPNGNMQRMLGNHPGVRGTTPQEWSAGQLNPTWVEWLMGLPLGWTDLGSWGTE